MQHRDADATRARILDAAVEEFARVGFAGARVDAIARRAAVSVRMIYHYFASKDGLYQTVLEEHVDRRRASLVSDYGLGELLRTHLEQFRRDESFVRLVQWDSLTAGHPTGGEGRYADARTRRYREIVDRLAAEQREGRLDPALDTDLLVVFIIALTSFPFAFPDIASRITGDDVLGETFRERYERFIQHIADRLDPPGG